MAQNFLACDREQQLLMPPSLREWLPDGHLAWFVLDAVGELDLTGFYAGYRADGHGRAAHDPAMMVALVLYAYAVGDRSARLIERRCVEDVAYRVIAANQTPDHATVARFRVRHEQALAGLFSSVLSLCARAGLVRAGTVALDGTKISADASVEANLDFERIAREIVQDAARVDREENERFGDRSGYELPPELADPVTRKQRLRAAKRELEAEWEAERQAAEEHNRRCQEYAEARAEGRPKIGRPPVPRPVPDMPTGRVNLTDPDSRPMKTRRGFIQGYNAQAAATENQIVVAAEVVVATNDAGLLAPMIAQVQDELAAAGVHTGPTVALADSGYWHGLQIDELAAAGIEALVPPDKQTEQAPSPARRGPASRRMRERLATSDGKQAYRQRQHMIEPVFAQTKVTRRADRFQRRGLAACRAEWRLITATHNLLKLWRHTLSPTPTPVA